MDDYYKLDGKVVVRCSSLLEWGEWFETAKRHVADEEISGIRISTVFLGLDHNFSRKGDPLLFETMVFLPDGTGDRMCRYFSWGEAEEGHKKMADLVRAEIIESGYDAAEFIGKLMLKISQ